MATDATGTPTSLGIPTYNLNADAPSGNGFNAAMATIDALFVARDLTGLSGSKTSTVTVTGGSVTFAAGTDILGSALSFTAVTGAVYRLSVEADSLASGGGTGSIFAVNLDGSSAGLMGTFPTSSGLPVSVATLITPGAGAHTVNVRIYNNGSGGATSLFAGAGGAGVTMPAFVTLERIA